MAHHSGPDDKGLDLLRSLFSEQHAEEMIRMKMEHLRLGPTFRHPEGSLTQDDEGELRMGVTNTEGKVVVAFGKPVDWIGFGPDQARDLAQSLLDQAQSCDGIEARVRRVGKPD